MARQRGLSRRSFLKLVAVLSATSLLPRGWHLAAHTRLPSASGQKAFLPFLYQHVPLTGRARQAAEALLRKVPVPTESLVYFVGPVAPGAIAREDVPDGATPTELAIPSTPGTYFIFWIDDSPQHKFAHPVRYAWIRLEDEQYGIVNASMPMTIYPANGRDPQPSDALGSDLVQGVHFTFLSGHMAGRVKAHLRPSAEVVTVTRQPDVLQGPLKQAIVIDLGDKKYGWWDWYWHHKRTLADVMAADADSIATWLKSEGFTVDRISQYWGNSGRSGYDLVGHPSVIYSIIKWHVKRLANISSGNACHTLFIYLSGHGYNKEMAADWGLPQEEHGLALYDVTGSGTKYYMPYSNILKNIIAGIDASAHKGRVKVTIFVDACFAGGILLYPFLLTQLCERLCGLTILTVVDENQLAAGGKYRYVNVDSGTQDFMQGADEDYDQDGKTGDIRDRFEEMKKQGGKKYTPKLFMCPGQTSMCTLD